MFINSKNSNTSDSNCKSIVLVTQYKIQTISFCQANNADKFNKLYELYIGNKSNRVVG